MEKILETGGSTILIMITGLKKLILILETGYPFYFSINNTPYVGFGHGDYINDNITIYNDFINSIQIQTNGYIE